MPPQLVFFFFIAVLAFKSKVTSSFPDSQRLVAASHTLFGESAASSETIFTLPVIALVAITLLNDGLIISICKDKVVPASKPQAWFLREIFSIAVTLGCCLVASNLCMLMLGMNAGPGAVAGDSCGQLQSDYTSGTANTAKCTGFVADFLGSDDLGTISYRQLKTMMYLSLSSSGFLTILSARTRGYFFSRRTGGYLGGATVVAFFVTTLMAVGVESISKNLDMDNIAWKQVGFVWAWVACWFVIQDCFLKVTAYKCIDWYYNNDKDVQTVEDVMHNLLSTNIEEERLTQRRTSLSGRGPSVSSYQHAADSAVSRPSRVTFDAKSSGRASAENKAMRDSYETMMSKFGALEKEMERLRAELANKKDKKGK